MATAGLREAVATQRLAQEGPNELPQQQKRSLWRIAADVLSEPMFGLLVVASLVYFLLGDLHEALILSGLGLMSVTIAVFQDWRGEKVLEALRSLTSPRALVIRDGVPQKIAGRDVVREDLLLLAEGDRIPADARIISPDAVTVDESLLTGESVAVAKAFGQDTRLYAGTLLVQGSCRAVVTATGLRSEIGKIGQSLHALETAQPRLRAQTRRIVKFFAVLSISFSALCVLIFGLVRGDWQQGFISGIALAMSLLPEEFPLVLTVFMVMGAWRISKLRVLTRKAAAIETLGSATVLCTDKTGTLTQNRMTIALLKAGEETWSPTCGQQDMPPVFKALLEAGRNASKAQSYDPMDLAFFEQGPATQSEVPVMTYGLQPDLLMMAQVFRDPEGVCVYAKGAPETIAGACGMDQAAIAALHQDTAALAKQGLRVLAVATARHAGDCYPDRADEFAYRLLGLVGFADPLREDIPAAVAQCRAAGIRVIMITGDYPETARAIAASAGIDAAAVLTGDAVRVLDDAGLRQAVATTGVFARISPDQKLRIVKALQAAGEVVAMTGDGVNDAPSLKAADIGVAMGGRGTDVAREAAAIVLLEDSFSAMVATIAMGRRIYDNLRKALIYVIAIHVPIAGLALLPLLAGGPLVLTPLLIALLEMVVDPVCSVVIEAEKEERDLMQRKPRNPKAALLPRPALLWGVSQGGLALAMLVAVWLFGLKAGLPEDELRALVFCSLMVANLALILANRSFSASFLHAFRRPNPVLGWGIIGVTCIFSLLMTWRPAQALFGFGPVHSHDLALAFGLGAVLLLLLETLKPVFQRRIFAAG